MPASLAFSVGLFWHCLLRHRYYRLQKTEMIQIDKAGRLVPPGPLREQFGPGAGGQAPVSVEGNSIRLEPADPGGTLVRKGTVLVFRGEFAEPVTTAKVNQLLAQERDARLAAGAGKPRKR